MNDSPGAIYLLHAGRADLARHMEDFYREVDEVIAGYSPVCRNRGLCCRFDAYGHRLYATTAEVAFFVRGMADERRPVSGGSCPYQVEGRCTARTCRPLGCRIFFCDPAAGDWQSPEYERHLLRLKELMDKLDVGYRYGEWLSALSAVDAARAVEKSSPARPD